jgi:hypothetical protein
MQHISHSASIFHGTILERERVSGEKESKKKEKGKNKQN